MNASATRIVVGTLLVAVLVGSANGGERGTAANATATNAAAGAAIRVASRDRSWLETPEGTPLFICGLGDPENFLYRGRVQSDGTRNGDQDAIIKRLAETGANSIYIQAVRSHGGDGEETHNPFLRNDPTAGINPAVLAQWHTWLQALDRAGIVTYFFIYDDGACLWGCQRKSDSAVPAEERAFLETLARAFPDVSRLVWVVAEEYQERFSAKRAAAMAAILREADPLRRPVGAHQLPGTGFDLASDPGVAVFAMQYGNAKSSAGDLHAAVVEARGKAAGRYNVTMSEIPYKGLGSGDEARRKMWAMAMGGAYVLANGWDGIATPRERLRECGDMVKFFQSADLRGMTSHDELALGDGEYVLASSDGRGVAYTSRAGDNRKLGIKGLAAGKYDLDWMDPVTGKTTPMPGTTLEKGAEPMWQVPPSLGAEAVLRIRPSPATK